jgi:hypothetical protein
MKAAPEPKPSDRCAECGHPYNKHRGKRGCIQMEPKAQEECPCPRFAGEPK